MPTTYREAGVDQERKDRLVDRVIGLSRRTYGPGVISLPWGFAGLFSLKNAAFLDRAIRNPVLVACADGVGTKIRIASAMGKHRGIGVDLVAMNVNDLVVTGGTPLFFLDYVASSQVDGSALLQLVEGMVDGCRQSGCALLGGETAEMPGMYAAGDYDVAGFAVGIVDQEKILDGKDVEEGDDVIGVASSGVHSNGFSLVRRVLDAASLKLTDKVPGIKGTLGDELLKPTRIYVGAVRGTLRRYKVKKAVKALANITGGGMIENIPRILPKGLGVEIREGSWNVPPIFRLLQERGGIDRAEMYRVFNMGVGFVMIAGPHFTRRIVRRLRGMRYKAWPIGKVVRSPGQTVVVP